MLVYDFTYLEETGHSIKFANFVIVYFNVKKLNQIRYRNALSNEFSIICSRLAFNLRIMFFCPQNNECIMLIQPMHNVNPTKPGC